MVFLAGEVCADYSLRLKQELDAERIWIHGYSNDFGCYVPSERLLKEGGYGGGGRSFISLCRRRLRLVWKTRSSRKSTPKCRRSFAAISRPTKAARTFPPPADALHAIRVRNDLVVELMAAEPLVATPVAIDLAPMAGYGWSK